MKININKSRNGGFVWMLLLIIIVVVIAIWMTVMLYRVATKPKPAQRWPTQDEVRADVDAFTNQVWAETHDLPDFARVQNLDNRILVTPDFFVINGPSTSLTDFSHCPSITLTPEEFDNWTIPATNVGNGYFQRLAVYTNIPPESSCLALFTSDVQTGAAPLEVSFFNYSRSSSKYIWDFGDGNTSTNEYPINLYSNPGSYTVTLTAYGNGATNILVSSNYIVVVPP